MDFVCHPLESVAPLDVERKDVASFSAGVWHPGLSNWRIGNEASKLSTWIASLIEGLWSRSEWAHQSMDGAMVGLGGAMAPPNFF